MKNIDIKSGYNDEITRSTNEADSYSFLADPDYKRQETVNKIYDDLQSVDWNKESDYHNTYYLGKGKYGRRELRMNNKLWHEKNK